MKHGYGGAYIIYYCCLCGKYYIESSYACLSCKLKEGSAEPQPFGCCHNGDHEVEIKVKKR